LYNAEDTLQALRTCQRPPNPKLFNKNIENENIRRLTEIECERLQGFPDGWTNGVSGTQRYKCLGNAVTVPVIKYLGELILQSFISSEKKS
jgi:site-specific DNA-cytosine methylase